MSVADFYDQLSPFYSLIYADWHATVQRQASQLDAVIRELWEGRVRAVLDAACGTGTQAIGLAGLGYQVTGSDISTASLERAKQEAERRSLTISLSRADMRTLSSAHPG